MNNSFSETYFVDGGTLRANTPSYVKRPADDELYEALMAREYCYILTPRQMGKSSLMIHTSQRLKEQNIKTAIVDIQGIGSNKDREWYASLLSQIRRGLRLSVDIEDWMKKKSNVGLGQLFVDFVQDVVLAEISEQVVIFLDEVDWMIKIDFRDDFFASIRSTYNARAQYPEFNRISFVLLGVASPADLISEPTRTPFNIGHAIPLQELSLADATPLQDGLEQVCPGDGKRILDRIFYWTNGHPYLTQKICKTIAETGKVDWSDPEVDDLVHRLFLAEESRKEANLKFIQDRILSNEQFAQMLKLYKRVRRSRIKESGQSILQNQLMLSGLLTSRDGYLEVRNRIYRTVFNDRWINKNAPKNLQRVALVSISSFLVVLLTVLGYNYTVSLRLKTYQSDYLNADSNIEKVSALASIYRLRYLFLSNTDIDLTAAESFYDFSSDSKTQLALFPAYEVVDPVVQEDLVLVINKLYITIANVDMESDNTSLLKAMHDALDNAPNNEVAKSIQPELKAWLDGRRYVFEGDDDSALDAYTTAIDLNPNNQATLYERAKIYIARGEYENALKDLDAAIGAAKQSAPDIPPTPTPTSSPTPPSETPIVLETQPSTTLLAPRATVTPPLGVTETPDVSATVTFTPTPLSAQPSATPASNFGFVPPPSPEKFESNFTTLNHVVFAIRVLIERTPGLQSELQISTATQYANLDSAGLIRAYVALATATPLKTSIGESEGEVSIIAWAGYIERGETDPAYDWVTQFEAETSCKVTVKNAATSDEMVALMNEGGFDLVTASGDASIRLIEAGLVQPINTELIPSWSTVDERLQQAKWHTIDDVHYGVPYQWAPNVLMYNTDVFSFPPTSWNIVFEEQILPDGQSNRGRVQAYDGPIYIADAALYLMATRPDLGITDPYKLNRSQFSAVVELLQSQRSLVQRYWHDAFVQMDDFTNEGVAVSGSWPFQANFLQISGVPIAWVIPAEGATGYADTTMMHVNAPHPNCAYLWLEHSIDTKVQGDIAAWMGTVPAVLDACTSNELLTDQGCAVNGFDSFDEIYFWKTPLSTDRCGDEACIPYSEWVSAYLAIVSGTSVPLQVNPGGSDKIALIANSDIFLMNIDGSDIRQLTNTNFSKFDLQWLPNGEDLLYVEGNCIFQIDTVATSVPETLACFTDSALEGFRVSPDGNNVAISIDSRLIVLPFDLDFLPTVTSAFELLKSDALCLDYTDVTVKSAQWSADGSSLAILYQSLIGQRLGETIRLLDIDLERCQSIVPLILDEIPGSHFIPAGYDTFPLLPSYNWDGFSLFMFTTFLRNDGWGDIYIYNLNDQSAGLVAPINGNCCYRDARFSPDGTYLLFAFQDINQGTEAETVLYYVPIGELNTGATFTPIRLPLNFFANPREGVQAALRPVQLVVNACGDGVDNDGDGAIDFPSDPNCTGLQDDSEDQ